MMVKRICNQLPTTIIGANNSLFATALNGQNETMNRKDPSDRALHKSEESKLCDEKKQAFGQELCETLSFSAYCIVI